MKCYLTSLHENIKAACIVENTTAGATSNSAHTIEIKLK